MEGLRGYIYVHLQLEGGLTCHERDGGEEEIANVVMWKACVGTLMYTSNWRAA